MDFTYDDEQLALQEVARGALERECPPPLLRELVDDESGITPALWSTLTGLGWTGLLVPEDQGGTGAGLLETCIVLEQMGRIPLPGPYFASAVAATLAARALGATELLADLASGARRGTVALGEQGHGEPLGTVRTRARRKGAQWVLSGEKPLVIDGHSADWAIVVARSEEGVRSYLIEAPGGDLVPSLDPTRKLARLVLDDTPAVPVGPSGSQAALWQRVQDDIAVALAAETVGAADRALAEAISYTSAARRLRQAGRDLPDGASPPGRDVPAGRDGPRRVPVRRLGVGHRVARTRPGGGHGGQLRRRGGVRVTGDDIQLHGGVGFTWANDAHFLFKRVKQNEILFGGAGAQRHRLASLFIESA